MSFAKSLSIFLIFGVIYFSPYLFLGQDTPVPLSDQLDSNHVWYKILKDQGAVFSSAETRIDGFLGSQWRFSYPSGFSVTALLYLILPVFEAFWINKVLIFSLGFWGMFFLLNRKFKIEITEAGLMACLWASCSFYPYLGAGISWIPGILYVGLVRRQRRPLFFLLSFLFPFFAETVLVSLFIWALAIFFLITSWFFYKRPARDLWASLMIFTLAIFLKDHQLALSFFSDLNFVSHRTEMFFNGKQGQGILDPFRLVLDGVFTGNSYWNGIGLAYFCLLLWNLRRPNPDILPYVLFVVSLALAAVVSLISFPGVLNWFGNAFPPLRSFNLTRFFNLISPIWFLGFFLSANCLPKISKRVLLILALVVQTGLVSYEWRSLLKSFWDNPNWSPNPTYREFYSEKAYDQLKKHLPAGYKGYLGHLNLPPAISAFHGLKTIDGYLVNYHLAHKQRLRRVMSEELQKDLATRNLFEFWGNKGYLMTAAHPEWVFNFKTFPNDPISELDFDWQYLRDELHTHYLISSSRLNLDELKLIMRVDHPESCWELFLYEIEK